MGAYCGIVFQYEVYDGRNKFKDPKTGAGWKSAIRMLVMFSFILVFDLVQNKLIINLDSFALYFILNMLCYSLLFFALFGLSDVILLKLRLLDSQDSD